MQKVASSQKPLIQNSKGRLLEEVNVLATYASKLLEAKLKVTALSDEELAQHAPSSDLYTGLEEINRGLDAFQAGLFNDLKSARL